MEEEEIEEQVQLIEEEKKEIRFKSIKELQPVDEDALNDSTYPCQRFQDSLFLTRSLLFFMKSKHYIIKERNVAWHL